MKKIAIVSGGFDPIHSGHIKLINDANKYGDVVVLLNSDVFLYFSTILNLKKIVYKVYVLKSIIDVWFYRCYILSYIYIYL